MDLALRDMGVDASMIVALHEMIDFMDDDESPPDMKSPHRQHHPSRTFIKETKAMKATAADIIEYPNAYHFVIDMPGIKSDQIKVHLEDGITLVVSGERRREKAQEGHQVKYLKMERRFGKVLKKFVLPEDANVDEISAVCEDGVLTVSVEKKPPPETKKPKVIQVKVGGRVVHEGGGDEGGRVEVKTGTTDGDHA